MRIKLIVALLLAGVIGCASATGKSSPRGDGAVVVARTIEKEKGVTEVMAVKVAAEVKSLNKKTRQISLVGPQGRELSFRVSDAVKRLDEINKGDTVVIEYLQSLAYELREPTAAEKKTPLSKVEMTGKATPEFPPEAGMVRSIKAIVTIVAIDQQAQTVDVRSPKGNVVTVQSRRPERLKKLKIGDTAAVTYTEAVVVGIAKM